MKKKLLLPLFLAFVLFLGLMACDNSNKKLATPTVTQNGDVIDWENVENATRYRVVVANTADETVKAYRKTESQFDINVIENSGTYKITVQAQADDYNESEYSNELTVTYTKRIEAPVISASSTLVSWNSVTNAKDYTITIKGEDEKTATTEELSYDIANLATAAGAYTVTVVANSNVEAYANSIASNELTVNYEYTNLLAAPSISMDTKFITWDEVENATSYEIYIDNESVAIRNVCSYLVPYSAGEHEIKVIAKTTVAGYGPSVDSNVISYKCNDADQAQGFLENTTGDFTKYENTDAYVKVTTASELFEAIAAAKYDYSATMTEVTDNRGYSVRNNVRKNETNWVRAITKGLYLKNADGTYTKIPADTPYSDTSYTASMTYYEDSNHSRVSYTQTLNTAGTVHVIEIMNDIELGWDKLSATDQALSYVADFSAKSVANETSYTMSDMYKEYGMSQITISRAYNLLIYSKNGAKLTHGGFKVESCNNICFRNLVFDEMWQWEDSASTSVAAVGDMDAFGWAYFKINYCDEVWIDHCTFGKAYDGLIDVANPTYNSIGTYSSAPYMADGSCDVNFSYCDFAAGSDDQNGYLYKMMAAIEAEYQAGQTNYLYYNALRDGGFSFEEILYGIAIPQKKAFLICDGTDSNYAENKDYNENMALSIMYCKFTDIEDRIPKVRSGSAYVYGCVVDASRYYTYRTVLKTKNAKTVVQAVNSTWKCGGVSQCIIASQDGSVYAEGCIFKGIAELVKNNDYGQGGIIIYNSRYVVDDIDYTGSITDENHKFALSGTISPDYFFWTTVDNIPFVMPNVDLTTLETTLAGITGAKANFTDGLTNYAN